MRNLSPFANIPALLHLAERVIGKLDLGNRWPCVYCGREGPEDELRAIESRVPDHPEIPTTLNGCHQCVDGDVLVELAHRALEEPESDAPKFGYLCQTCGEGTVQLCIMPYATRIKGNPFTVEDAKIGVCDQCGESHFSAVEHRRWRQLYDAATGGTAQLS